MKRLNWGVLLGTALAVLGAGPLAAQGVNDLGDAVLQLQHRVTSPTQQEVDDRLYNGRVTASIFDRDNDNSNFAATDLVAFALTPITGNQRPLAFGGTRADFDDWIVEHADEVMAILFPRGIVEGASGIDVAHSHSQSFLLSTALAVGARPDIGGRVEFENFDVADTSGHAVQGLFKAKAFATELRYAQMNDTIRTKSTTFGFSGNPSWGPESSGTSWRIGVDGYFSGMYSTSRALELWSMDYGGGPWGSWGRDIDRLSFNLGGLMLGSRTYIPEDALTDGFRPLAAVINDRGVRWDLTYGGTVEYKLSRSIGLGTQALETRSVSSPVDGAGVTSHVVIANIIFHLGGDDPLNFGYKYSSTGDPYSAHGFFMNANIRWER